MTFNAVNVTPPPPFPDAEVALHLFYQIGEFYPCMFPIQIIIINITIIILFKSN